MKKTDLQASLVSQYAATLPEEKRSEWRFSSADNGLWRWRVTHPDGSEVSAHIGFATLKQCIADATKHGYIVWIPEAERRKVDS